MITKVRAARVAARSGADTLILGGRLERALERVSEGEVLGTFLSAGQQPQAASKRWISGQLQTRGTLVLDDGAVQVLRERERRILHVGVTSVHSYLLCGHVVDIFVSYLQS